MRSRKRLHWLLKKLSHCSRRVSTFTTMRCSSAVRKHTAHHQETGRPAGAFHKRAFLSARCTYLQARVQMHLQLLRRGFCNMQYGARVHKSRPPAAYSQLVPRCRIDKPPRGAHRWPIFRAWLRNSGGRHLPGQVCTRVTYFQSSIDSYGHARATLWTQIRRSE